MCKNYGVAGSTPDARAGNSNMQKLHKKLENCKIFQNPARVDVVEVTRQHPRAGEGSEYLF